MVEVVCFACTVLLLASNALSAACQSRSALPFEQRTLVVDGYGSSTAAADVASVSFSVSASAPDAVSARQKATGLVRSISEHLKGKYYSDQNISLTTSSLNVYPQYGYTAKAFSSYVRGYDFYITLNAALQNITAATLSGVIDAIINAGNPSQVSSGQTSVSSIEFGLSTTVSGALYRASRKNAVLDALNTAKEYCSYLGLTLGNVLQLNETTTDTKKAGPFSQPSTAQDVSMASYLNGTNPIILPPQAVDVHVKAVFAVYGAVHPTPELAVPSPSPYHVPFPPPPEVPTGVAIHDPPAPPLYESLFRAGFPRP